MINIGFSDAGKKIKKSGEDIQSFIKDKTVIIKSKLERMPSSLSGMARVFHGKQEGQRQSGDGAVNGHSNLFSFKRNEKDKKLTESLLKSEDGFIHPDRIESNATFNGEIQPSFTNTRFQQTAVNNSKDSKNVKEYNNEHPKESPPRIKKIIVEPVVVNYSDYIRGKNFPE